MKKGIVSFLAFLLLAVLCISMASCDEGVQIKDEEKKEEHYLVFYVENLEIAKMYVTEDDTYESLKPYFPTIPEKDGFTGAWEKVESVYSEKDKEITINAYYTKKR